MIKKGKCTSIPIICTVAVLLVIIGCSSNRKKDEIKYVKKVWRINPSSVVLNKSTQIFISGKNLDSMKITAGETVEIERGKVSGKGTKQQLMIKVSPYAENDTSDYKDELGKREIRVHTGKKNEELFLNILDEDPKSEIEDVDHVAE